MEMYPQLYKMHGICTASRTKPFILYGRRPLVIGYEYNGRRDTREQGDGRGDQKNSQSLLTNKLSDDIMSIGRTEISGHQPRRFSFHPHLVSVARIWSAADETEPKSGFTLNCTTFTGGAIFLSSVSCLHGEWPSERPSADTLRRA